MENDKVKYTALIFTPLLLIVMIVIGVRLWTSSNAKTAEKDSPKASSTAILADTYQGVLEGYTRRIRLENQEKKGNLIVFKYTVVGSTSFDKNKQGVLDISSNLIEFETLGKGTLKRENNESVIYLDNGTVFKQY